MVTPAQKAGDRSRSRAGGGSRSTLFYETDDVFRESMAQFIDAGLSASESVITISTNDHRAALLDVLSASLVDVRAALATGQLLMLDAREILCAIMPGTHPSADRFDAVVTKMFDRVAARRWRAPIRIFSEMVDILVRTDRSGGANELDALWEELAQKRDFTLLTAHSVERSELRATIAKTLPQMRAVDTDRALIARESGERLRVRAPVDGTEGDRARDELVATMSHELRTPLNAILAFATLLETKVDEPEVVKAVQAVVRNARLQARLIDDLLDVSRIAAGKVLLETSALDLVRVVEEAIESVSSTAREKSITVDFFHASPNEPFIGDPSRLAQVVSNLLTNAVKFSERGGTVDVRLTRTDHSIELTVSDCGSGIDPEFLPHAFERFRQAGPSSSRRTGGLGLGLAISEELVLLHNGTIRAASDGPAKGATFTVTLPIAETPATVRPPSTTAAQFRTALDGVAVLVVDDDADARALLTSLLESSGATVVSAASADGARAMLSELRPDVIVSDVRMPGEDGCAFVRSLANVPGASAIPAIALTGFTSEGEKWRAIEAGFCGHVAKPVKIDVIIDLILAHVYA